MGRVCPSQFAPARTLCHGLVGWGVRAVGPLGTSRAKDGALRVPFLGRSGEGGRRFGMFLGVVGLYEGSGEAPKLAGLGLLPGRCYRLGTVRLKPDPTDTTGVR